MFKDKKLRASLDNVLLNYDGELQYWVAEAKLFFSWNGHNRLESATRQTQAELNSLNLKFDMLMSYLDVELVRESTHIAKVTKKGTKNV